MEQLLPELLEQVWGEAFAGREAASRIAATSFVSENKVLPRALNRLDVMHPAPIPIGAEPAATRRGEMVE